jgi:gas vesicle protein
MVNRVVHKIKEADMEEERQNRRIAAGALLLLAGGIIGAGTALLLAPQSGRKTRRDISRCAQKVKARADEKMEDIAVSISDLVETVGEKTDDLMEKGKDLAGDARKELIRLIEDGASALEKFRAKLRKM